MNYVVKTEYHVEQRKMANIRLITAVLLFPYDLRDGDILSERKKNQDGLRKSLSIVYTFPPLVCYNETKRW